MTEHIVINEHGAVILGPGRVESPSWVEAAGGEVVGWISDGGCENEHCLAEIAAGRPWHAISRGFALVLDPIHFATAEEAIEAVVEASKSEAYEVRKV